SKARPMFERQIAFPNANDPPTFRSKRACHDAISSFVSIELRSPPLGAVFWQRRVLWFRAAVPKASVNEHDYALATKYEVRFAEEILASAPAMNSVLTE